MTTAMQSALRTHLRERQQGLRTAVSEHKEAMPLVNLLKEVDAALERMDRGSYGVCMVCNDTVEDARLLEDPLVCMCFSHLSEEQQRSIERDLELASQVQKKLLPKRDLTSGGWQIDFHYQPAGIVSGDYCDVMTSEDHGDVYFLVGDISGKGVAASLLMSHLHAIFHSLVAMNLSVDKLMERANALFSDRTLSGHYATLALGRANPSGTIYLCNAGHCPLFVHSGGGVYDVDSTGLPIGLFASSKYTMKEIQMTKGDTILLYTDGVTEARDSYDNDFGTSALTDLLRAHHNLEPRDLLDKCRKGLSAFRGETPLFDDVTLMVVKKN
jgi:sigma-B regulation protein RsbU (phosphoserine phosphatase)